jgi:large subunit ribosomal protein L7/L12
VIRVLREITGCGLRQAKEMVDVSPGVVAVGLSAEGAQRAASMLEAVGAVVHTSQLPPR